MLLDDALLREVYTGGTDVNPWHSLMPMLAERLAADNCIFVVTKSTWRAGWENSASHRSRRTVALQARYVDLSDQDPTRHDSMAIGELRDLAEIESPSYWRSDFYRQFAQPLAQPYMLCLHVGRKEGLKGWLQVTRGQTAGRFDAHDRRALAALSYHFEGALSLAEQMRLVPTVPASGLDLTPAERRLTHLLCQGLSVAEASQLMRITAASARSYLKRIYARNSLNGQAALVATAMRGTDARDAVERGRWGGGQAFS